MTRRALLVGCDAFITHENTAPSARMNVERMARMLQSDIRGYASVTREDQGLSGVEDLADSAVVLRFTVACREQNVFVARRRLNRELRLLFAKHSIGIPYPQITVWKGE